MVPIVFWLESKQDDSSLHIAYLVSARGLPFGHLVPQSAPDIVPSSKQESSPTENISEVAWPSIRAREINILAAGGKTDRMFRSGVWRCGSDTSCALRSNHEMAYFFLAFESAPVSNEKSYGPCIFTDLRILKRCVSGPVRLRFFFLTCALAVAVSLPLRLTVNGASFRPSFEPAGPGDQVVGRSIRTSTIDFLFVRGIMPPPSHRRKNGGGGGTPILVTIAGCHSRGEEV
ncbi:hypothetical protein DFH06DRAFT_1129480 [Mycena polygramma]|nr:hypothetical protein DFH06DRAFT_1129480 [Mycena polygramma]